MADSSGNNPKQPTKGILAGMRIRKKLIVLHTIFSVCLGIVLLIAIRPAMSKVIDGAETDQAEQIIELFHVDNELNGGAFAYQLEHARIEFVDSSDLEGVSEAVTLLAQSEPMRIVPIPSNSFASGVIQWMPDREQFFVVRARSSRARETIRLVYILVILTLVAGYALVAFALELLVLPEHVYRPLSEILEADQAVREGDRKSEIIPENVIPADELGSIMRSRNQSILALRENEKQLAKALDRLEHTAADLHKKNHLLETARKNLEGADRLASLGMMSAGIAHELNTPLAVVKGLVDKLNADKSLSLTEIALLARVVARLEILSDGLLDFARVRPPKNIQADVWQILDEARTLVKLDRFEQLEHSGIEIVNHIEPNIQIACDPDRLVQVFVNLIRNGVDALINTESAVDSKIELFANIESRDGVPWAIIRVEDNGPGIDSALIDRLFEPFVSSRLDSHGTGLGLAVANGIIREHGGVLIATNRPAEDMHTGALFEVVLPMIRSVESI